ncbi:MAG: acyl-CoA thioester hydrolase/BAAT C-terminal domain-containing protein [Planctomycetota bacterium]
MKRVPWQAAILLSALTAGCVVHMRSMPARIDPPFAASPPPPVFSYAPDPAPLPCRWETNEDGETSLRVTFPARPDLPGEVATVDGHLCLAAGAPAPAVLVLPILGGRYDLSRSLAFYLARRGLSAFWLERRGRLLDPEHPLEAARAEFRAAVIDGRRALDWLETSPLVRGDRLGLFGVSRGGIVGALLAATDERIRASALALAGGDLALMLEASEETEVVRFRDAQVLRYRQSHDEFRAACRELLLEVDPLTYAGRVDPASVLMISAMFDAVVPRSSSQALWRALGRPTLIEYPTGHYGMIVFLWDARARAASHLRDKLL